MPITVFIGGTFRHPAAISISRRTGGRDTASMTFDEETSGWIPLEGMHVAISDAAAQPVFGGNVLRVKTIRHGDSDWLHYEVDCVSYDARVDRRFIVESGIPAKTFKQADFANCGAIFTWILTNCLVDELPGISPQIENGYALAVGEKIVFGLDGPVRCSDAFTLLAERSGYAWWVDADGNAHFSSGLSDPAPIEITGTGDNYETLSVERTGEEYRNSEWVRYAWEGGSSEINTLDAESPYSHEFMLFRPAAIMLAITATQSVQAFAIFTLSDFPLNNETVVIDGVTYTFKDEAEFDNDIAGHIRIDAVDETQDLIRLRSAINDDGDQKGYAYSSATTVHPTCAASWNGSTELTAMARLAGAAGNAILVSDTVTAGDWDGLALHDGSDGAEFPQSFGNDQESGRQWYWSPGDNMIRQADTEAPVILVTVEYRAIGGNMLQAYDGVEAAARATAAGGSGIWEHFLDRQDTPDQVAAFAQAVALRDSKKHIPYSIDLVTNSVLLGAGNVLAPGQILSLDCTVPPITQSVLLTEVNLELLNEDVFRYAAKGSTTALDDWVSSWVKVASGGASGNLVSPSSGGGAGVTPSSGAITSSSVTLIADTEIPSPPGLSIEGMLLLRVIQDGTGGWEITWSADFEAGTPTGIHDAADSETRFVFVGVGGVWVQAAPFMGREA